MGFAPIPSSTGPGPPGIKRQSYIEQISREKVEGVTLLDVEKNKGVKVDD